MNVYSKHQLFNMERSKTKWQKHPNKRFKGQDGQEAARGEPDYELNEFKLGSPKFD